MFIVEGQKVLGLPGTLGVGLEGNQLVLVVEAGLVDNPGAVRVQLQEGMHP